MGVVSPWKRLRREKGCESRQAPRRIPSNFLRIVCRGAFLLSSHRCCLVISISSGHAVNDLKRVVSPWTMIRREKGGESRQAPRRIPSNFLPIVCRGASLVSSHRRCLVVSISSGHAVNDLKRVVSPWKRIWREKGGESPQISSALSAAIPPSSDLTAVAWWSQYHPHSLQFNSIQFNSSQLPPSKSHS